MIRCVCRREARTPNLLSPGQFRFRLGSAASTPRSGASQGPRTGSVATTAGFSASFPAPEWSPKPHPGARNQTVRGRAPDPSPAAAADRGRYQEGSPEAPAGEIGAWALMAGHTGGTPPTIGAGTEEEECETGWGTGPPVGGKRRPFVASRTIPTPVRGGRGETVLQRFAEASAQGRGVRSVDHCRPAGDGRSKQRPYNWSRRVSFNATRSTPKRGTAPLDFVWLQIRLITVASAPPLLPQRERGWGVRAGAANTTIHPQFVKIARCLASVGGDAWFAFAGGAEH